MYRTFNIKLNDAIRSFFEVIVTYSAFLRYTFTFNYFIRNSDNPSDISLMEVILLAFLTFFS